MRWIRGAINTVLTVTLVRPIVRRMLARTRRWAREHPVSPLMIPAQELLETALLAELAATDPSGLPALEDVTEEVAGGSTLRTLLLVGALATVISVTASVGVTLIRRRRKARTPEPENPQREWVAVPVDGSAEATVDAEVPAAELSTP